MLISSFSQPLLFHRLFRVVYQFNQFYLNVNSSMKRLIQDLLNSEGKLNLKVEQVVRIFILRLPQMFVTTGSHGLACSQRHNHKTPLSSIFHAVIQDSLKIYPTFLSFLSFRIDLEIESETFWLAIIYANHLTNKAVKYIMLKSRHIIIFYSIL